MSQAASNGRRQSRNFEPPALLPISLFPQALHLRHRHQPATAPAMSALRLTSILLILLWSLPREPAAQSLAEVAERERTRRAQLPHAAVTHTNEALQGYAGRPAASSSGRAKPVPHPSRFSRSGETLPGRPGRSDAGAERFLQVKARLAAAEQRQREPCGSKLDDLNLKLQGDPFRQTTVTDPAHVYGPLIAQAQRRLEQSRQVLIQRPARTRRPSRAPAQERKAPVLGGFPGRRWLPGPQGETAEGAAGLPCSGIEPTGNGN